MGANNFQYGFWPMVIFNVLLFGGFAFGFIRPKKRIEWRRFGLFVGFLVALFLEMYGVPLTVYILVSMLGWVPAQGAFQHINGHILGTVLGFSAAGKYVVCLLGGITVLTGLLIMGRAWKQIHQAGSKLVTGGIYNRVRHPQYSGLILIIIGFLIQWPTLITLIMAPILGGAYVNLAYKEERTLRKKYGEQFEIYRAQVPAFIPKLSDFL